MQAGSGFTADAARAQVSAHATLASRKSSWRTNSMHFLCSEKLPRRIGTCTGRISHEQTHGSWRVEEVSPNCARQSGDQARCEANAHPAGDLATKIQRHPTTVRFVQLR